jgi:hypothetical protein
MILWYPCVCKQNRGQNIPSTGVSIGDSDAVAAFHKGLTEIEKEFYVKGKHHPLGVKHHSIGWALSQSQRPACAIGTFVLMALLGIAFWLEPSPRGFGTHLQLGLPQCSSYAWFGVPCPSCGMTTSWALVGDGELATAMRVNLAGTLLCFQAMISCPWLAWLACSNQPAKNRWFVKMSSYLLAIAFVIALSQWSFRAAAVGFVRQPIDVTTNKNPN